MQHRCHSDENCPPCTALTEKWCMGKHEVFDEITLSLSLSLSATLTSFDLYHLCILQIQIMQYSMFYLVSEKEKHRLSPRQHIMWFTL